MKENSTKKKITKKPVGKQAVKKKTNTKTVKKQSVKKKITTKAVKTPTKTKAKTTKKPVKKKETKKPIKKVKKQTTKKVTSKTKSKVTKKPIKKTSRSTAKKTSSKITRKPVETVFENVETVTNSIDFDLVESIYSEKQSKEKKLKVSIVICVILFALLAVSIFTIFRNNKKPQKNNVINEVKYGEPIDNKFKNIWNEYHDNSYVQDDYIGQIVFESGIINEPVMQGETNDTYLNRNYSTYKYEVCGPVFMDFACKKDDQNLVLYGHTRSKAVDPNRVMMFTPLHLLEDKDNYEANKTIYFVYEDSVDVYLVSSVYSLQTIVGDDGLQYLKEGEPLYYLNSYSDSEFSEYVKTVKQRQLYDTGVEITAEDKLLTLQTCLEGSTDKFIVLAKKIETRQYK